MLNRAYVVVPFERFGTILGPKRVLMCDQPAHARMVAQQLASLVAGVAILQREIDPETGDDRDTLIAEIGAIPPSFPTSATWSVRLN